MTGRLRLENSGPVETSNRVKCLAINCRDQVASIQSGPMGWIAFQNARNQKARFSLLPLNSNVVQREARTGVPAVEGLNEKKVQIQGIDLCCGRSLREAGVCDKTQSCGDYQCAENHVLASDIQSPLSCRAPIVPVAQGDKTRWNLELKTDGPVEGLGKQDIN